MICQNTEVGIIERGRPPPKTPQTQKTEESPAQNPRPRTRLLNSFPQGDKQKGQLGKSIRYVPPKPLGEGVPSTKKVWRKPGFRALKVRPGKKKIGNV